MPERSLPARPSLEQYKNQAKDLARACRAGEPAALARMNTYHPHPPAGRIALAHAQLVLAREHGFDTWPRFAAHIEQLRIAAAVADLADPADAFLRAALVPRDGTSHSSGTLDEARAILARYPQIAGASLPVACVLADEAAVRGFIASSAGSLSTPAGPYGWDALCHLCFSRYLRLDPTRSEAFVGTARVLLDAGANPNTGWYEEPGRPGDPPVWESVLYGAAGVAHHPGLTRLLLERGADPNDGETPYHVPENYDNTVLEILLASGKLDEKGKSWVLGRKADWHDIAGLRLALDHGANPNYIPHWGNTALQHAILRDNSLDMLRLLLERGADPLLKNHHGRSALTLAAHRGRGDFLRIIRERDLQLDLHLGRPNSFWPHAPLPTANWLPRSSRHIPVCANCC